MGEVRVGSWELGARSRVGKGRGRGPGSWRLRARVGKAGGGVPGALPAGKMKLEFFENPSSTLLG